MFARTFLLTICLGVSLTVAGVAAAPAGGFKLPGTLSPTPPLTRTALPLNCHLTPEGNLYLLECHNTDPNPFPPKDTKSLTVREAGVTLKVTAYPDGDVVLTGRVKASKL